MLLFFSYRIQNSVGISIHLEKLFISVEIQLLTELFSVLKLCASDLL